MMKLIYTAAMALALAGFAAAPAKAAYMKDLGTFDGSPQAPTTFFHTPGAGSFTDTYTFKITKLATGSAQAGFTFSSKLYKFSSLVLSVFKAGNPTALDSQVAPSGTNSASVNFAGGAGAYYLTVSGKANSSLSTYTGSLSVSAVPLPASLPMFGAALLGLGAFGVMMRGRAKSKEELSASFA